MTVPPHHHEQLLSRQYGFNSACISSMRAHYSRSAHWPVHDTHFVCMLLFDAWPRRGGRALGFADRTPAFAGARVGSGSTRVPPRPLCPPTMPKRVRMCHVQVTTCERVTFCAHALAVFALCKSHSSTLCVHEVGKLLQTFGMSCESASMHSLTPACTLFLFRAAPSTQGWLARPKRQQPNSHRHNPSHVPFWWQFENSNIRQTCFD